MAFVRFAVEEPELAVEYPLGRLPKLSIFAFEQVHELSQVDCWGAWTRDDVLLVVKQVSWIQPCEFL